MWVLSLGREGPLEEGMVTHSSVRAWTTLWNEEPGSPWGCKESDTHARTMLPYIFCCSDGSSLDCWGLLHLAPMSTWILLLFLLLPPAPAPSSSFSFFLFFSHHFLASGHRKVFQAHPGCFLL